MLGQSAEGLFAIVVERIDYRLLTVTLGLHSF
jgi:hypothetical protein